MDQTTHEPARGGAALDHPRRCTARRHDGQPCRRYAARGATVCRTHGGAAPQVQAAAKRRLQQATDALAAKLLGIALDEGAPEAVRLAAIRDALDRGGVTAKQAVEVEANLTVQPWQQIASNLTGIAHTTQEESRRARGLPVDDLVPQLPAADDSEPIDAEVCEPRAHPPWEGEQLPKPQQRSVYIDAEEAATFEAEQRRRQKTGTKRIRSRRV